MPARIRLSSSMFPVQAFFNAVPDEDFVITIERLCAGRGAAFNVASCIFPDPDALESEQFEGVMFSLDEEECIVTEAQFFQVLRDVVDSQTSRVPAQALALERALAAER